MIVPNITKTLLRFDILRFDILRFDILRFNILQFILSTAEKTI